MTIEYQVRSSSEERAECGGLLQKRTTFFEAKSVDTFNASDSRQSSNIYHKILLVHCIRDFDYSVFCFVSRMFCIRDFDIKEYKFDIFSRKFLEKFGKI